MNSKPRRSQPVKRFGYDDKLPEPTKKALAPKKEKYTSESVKVGTFLAVRNDADGFYIARLKVAAELFGSTNKEKISISWYTNAPENDSTYRKEFDDKISSGSIISIVKMKKRVISGEFTLTNEELNKIKNTLTSSLKAASGEEVHLLESGTDNEVTSEEEDEVEATTEEDVPTPAKKRKTVAAAANKKIPKTTRLKKTLTQKEREKKEREDLRAKKKEEQEAEKQRKKEEREAKKNMYKWALKPHESVMILTEDPFFDTAWKGGSSPTFVSTENYSKLVIAAVIQNDPSRLEKLIQDVQRVHSAFLCRSVNVVKNSVSYALLMNNTQMLRILMNESNKPTMNRVSMPTLLEQQGTGSYNKTSLGLGRILKINISRGSKEGNNALTVATQTDIADKKQLYMCLENGVKVDTVKFFLTFLNNSHLLYWMGERAYIALRWGHPDLALWLIEEMLQPGHDDGGFGRLHAAVLKAKEVKDLPAFRNASITKKTYTNQQITPLHCAACNPNPAILAKLLNLCPNYNVADKNGWRPIHYAAACSSTATLQLLLKKGVSPDEVTTDGRTPMHVACTAGREKNVELLLQNAYDALQAQKRKAEKKLNKSKAQVLTKKSSKQRSVGGRSTSTLQMRRQDTIPVAQNEEEDMEVDADADADNEEDLEDEGDTTLLRFGLAGINRPITTQMRPIHMAAYNGRFEVIQVLLKYCGQEGQHGAGEVWALDIDAPCSTSKNKVTALMLAAEHGDLNIVRALIEKGGAKVEALDRLKRTALTHAVLNGQTCVASYLLNMGSNPNHQDNSGNSLLHYAAAYGWLPCTELLLRCGADPNHSNHWQTTPLSISFMKGHIGLVRRLLEQPGVGVNCKDENGLTLLMMACRSKLESGLEQQISYLLKDMQADAVIMDALDQDALHWLAQNSIFLKHVPGQRVPQLCPVARDTCLAVARQLLAGGCEPALADCNGRTPMDKALMKANEPLTLLLHEQCGALSCPDEVTWDTETTSLHTVVQLLEQMDVEAVLRKLCESPFNTQQLRKIVKIKDTAHITAFAQACLFYQTLSDRTTDDKVWQDLSERAIRMLKFLVEELKADVLEVMVDPDVLDSLDTKEQNNEVPHRNSRKTMKDSPHRRVHTYGLSKVTQLEHNNCALYFPAAAALKDSGKALKVLLKLAVQLHGAAKVASFVNRRLHGQRTLLHEMTLLGVEPAVEALIEVGADVNALSANKDDEGETALFAAVRNVHLSLVKLLLLKGGADLKITSKLKKSTVLHVAASSYTQRTVQQQTVIELLLSHGHGDDSPVRALDENRRTPLHLAANSSATGSDASTEIEEAMLRAGAQLLLTDCRHRLPLHYAFVKIGKHKETASSDPIGLVSVLCPREDSRALDVPDQWGSRPLHRAAAVGATVSVMYLVEQGHNKNAQQIDGNTPLTLAARNRHLNCCMTLLQLGCDFQLPVVSPPVDEELKGLQWTVDRLRRRQTDQMLRSLLHVVLEHDWQGVAYILVEKLLSKKSVVSVLEECLRAQKYHFALALIRRRKNIAAELGQLNAQGQTLLHVLAETASHDAQVAELQLRIARIFHENNILLSVDKKGCWPVTYAALRHHHPLLEFFLDTRYHATPNLIDAMGRSLLTTYMWNADSTSDLSLLPKFFVAPDAAHVDNLLTLPCLPTLWLTSSGNLPRIDYFSREHSTPQCAGLSPLMAAVRLQHLQLAKTILRDCKADVNRVDPRRRTALSHAVLVNAENIVRLLLDHSLDLSELEKQKFQLKKQASRTAFNLFDKNSGQDDEEEDSDDNDDDEEDDDDDDKMEEKDEDENEEMEEDDSTVPKTDANDAAKTEEEPELDFLVGFPLTSRVSDVNVNHCDLDGHSPLDLLVEPTPDLTFDNGALLHLLLHAGCKPSPDLLTKCLNRGAVRCAKSLQLFKKVPRAEWQLAMDAENGEDEMMPEQGKMEPVDFEKDSQEMRQELESYDESSRTPDRYVPLVDSNCSTKHCQLVEDKRLTGGRFFDVLLNKVDVGAGRFGLYNFYKMQLVYQKGRNLYFLFTRWGRIGDTGQMQNTPFPTLEEGQKEFDKVFRAKTGNKWLAIDDFEKKEKKYSLVALEKLQAPSKSEKLKVDLRTDLKSKLSPELQVVIRELMDEDLIVKSIEKAKFDHDRSPFGRISAESLEKAAQLLQEIASLSAKVQKMVQNIRNSDPQEAQRLSNELKDLSSQYFQLVPQYGFEFDAIKPLISDDDISTQLQLMMSLSRLQFAQQTLLGAMRRRREIHPLDYAYSAAGCRLTPVAESDLDAQVVLQYLRGSADLAKVTVDGLFAVVRNNARPREALTGNRKLLWHGTSAGNLLSILHHGLLVAPPGVDRHGWLFGRGIYLADVFAKSEGYMSNYSSKCSTLYMLLCEVCLDDMVVKWSGDDEAEEEGTERPPLRLIMGQQAPKSTGDILLSSGCQVPLGTVGKAPNAPEQPNVRYHMWRRPQYSEYVVVDESRIRLRYLLRLNANNKNGTH